MATGRLADRLADPRPSQESHAAGLELKVRIQQALAQLSPELREAVVLPRPGRHGLQRDRAGAADSRGHREEPDQPGARGTCKAFATYRRAGGLGGRQQTFRQPKVLQFGDKTGGNRSGDSGHCAQCEAMLADALDGTLSAADQALFDRHMAECGPCSQLLADARRGAAFWRCCARPRLSLPPSCWNVFWRRPADKLAQASRFIRQRSRYPLQPAGQFGVAALTHRPGHSRRGRVWQCGSVPRRVAAAFRASGLGQIMLQPRLAMTAAMAFFSIALTMNLTGIHPHVAARRATLRPAA